MQGKQGKGERALSGFDNPAVDLTDALQTSKQQNGHTAFNGVNHAPIPNGKPHVELNTRDDTHVDERMFNMNCGTCLPCRCVSRDAKEMPVNKVGFLSYLTSAWTMPMLWRGCRQQQAGGLSPTDLWEVSERDTAHVNCQRLEALWQEQLNRKDGKPSFFKAWFRFIRFRFFVSLVVMLLCLGFMFVSSVWMIRQLLDYVESPQEDVGFALQMVGILMVAEILRSLFFTGTWMINHHSAVRLKGAISAMLYKKVLRTTTLQANAVGELVNLMTQDSNRVFEATSIFVLILAAPAALVIGISYSVYVIGPWALIGCLVFLLTFVIQTKIAKVIGTLRQKCVTIADKRVRLMSEILNNVKMIKMYSWAQPFASKIVDIRKQEKKKLTVAGFLQSLVFSLMVLAPVAAAAVTFTIHTLTGNNLTAPQAFTLIAIFTYIRAMLNILPNAARAVSEAKVSFARIQKVLMLKEGQAPLDKPLSTEPHVPMCFINASFRWPVSQSDSKPTQTTPTETTPDSTEAPSEPPLALEHINLHVKKGELIGICGPVGSGKSALFAAILNELTPVSGQAAVHGSIGYVPQQPWIQNGTLRDNILFGTDYDQDRYESVVKDCGLKQDLNSLPAGDETEIGERGVNLSGGQKQRLSLARALYSDRDLYLLDDTLSAVDSNMAHHIFTNCISRALATKTVLFITHSIKFLKECDNVVVMRDGRIVETGSHMELTSLGGQYAQLVQKWDTPETAYNADGSSNEGSDSEPESSGKDTEGTLVQKEGMGKSRASTKTLRAYIAHGGWLTSLLLLLAYIMFIACSTFSSWWLSYWLGNSSKVSGSNQNATEGDDAEDGQTTHADVTKDPQLRFYLAIYGFAAVGILIFAVIKAGFFVKMTVGSSMRLHDKVLRRVMDCPMSFFDTNPTGRILNRFSKDQDEVDIRLPFFLDLFLQNLLIIIASLSVIAVVFPWFLVAIVPLFLIFFLINLLLAPGIRNFKRIDNITLSPIISHLTASVQGRATIVSMNREAMFYKQYLSLVDRNSSSLFMFYSSTRWLGCCLDLFTALLTTTTAVFVVLNKGSLPAGMAGLALTYATQVTGLLQFTVRLKSETESRLTSAERIFEYLVKLPSEMATDEQEKLTPSDWPSGGAIKMEDVSMSYRPGKPLALDNISLDIHPCEKIGIVGRTGSGKSSLASMLFRLVEPNSGRISVDHINVADVRLECLRARLAAIPQEPVLFSGTIRYNLDPFNVYDDNALWDALERAHIKNKILGLPQRLEEMVVENGDNFSVGEKQLFCLARAIIRNSQILVLDEATASVDVETDSRIQSTVREAFHHCTVITIAHRLDSILDCDRVLVMDQGKVAEFDSPSQLLDNHESKFFHMLSTQGHRLTTENHSERTAIITPQNLNEHSVQDNTENTVKPSSQDSVGNNANSPVVLEDTAEVTKL